MLGRILNINAEFSGSGNHNRKNSRFLNSEFDDSPNKRSSSDSLNLSPAAVFFLRLNIFLKEFSQDEKDEFTLRFNVGRYKFYANVSAMNSTKKEYQLYKISDFEKLNEGFQKSTVDLLVSPGLITELESSNPFVLEYLDMLFTRIKSLKLNKSLDRRDSYAISALLDGFYSDFVQEMSKINTAVFRFIDKSNNTDLCGDTSRLRIFDPPIVIDKVSISQI